MEMSERDLKNVRPLLDLTFRIDKNTMAGLPCIELFAKYVETCSNGIKKR
jgi:hypothetical protein